MDYYPIFKKVERQLAAQEWFADGWVFYTGHFNDGIFLQLYKPWWHNHNQKGIHLETWVSIDGVNNGSIPLVLHTERETPRREEFNRLLIERGGEIMAAWPGYWVSRKNTMEHFLHRFPLVKTTMVRKLVAEFSRVQEIGGIIDGILRELDDR